MKLRVSIAFIIMILVFIPLCYPDLLHDTPELVQTLNELTTTIIPPRDVAEFDNLIKKSLSKFFNDSELYHQQVARGQMFEFIKTLPQIKEDLEEIDLMIANVSTTKNLDFIKQELIRIIKLLIAQEKVNVPWLFDYALPLSLSDLLQSIIQQDAQLKQAMINKFNSIIESKARKIEPFDEMPLNEAFLANFSRIDFLLDALSPLSLSTSINSMSLPENTILYLLKREEQQYSNAESFKKNYLDQPQDGQRNTVLMKAAEAGSAVIVQWLLGKGAAVNLKNKQGLTATALAEKAAQEAPASSIKGYMETLEYLRAAGGQ